MIRLVYSNRTEQLLAALAADLDARAAAGAPLLEPTEIVVPNRNMETFVRLGLAQARGIAANLRFRRLERFVNDLVAEAGGTRRVVDRDVLEAWILAVLLDDEALSAPDLAPVKAYVEREEGGGELRRVQLAGRLAGLFQDYAFSRADLLRAWAEGTVLRDPAVRELEAWQRALWLRLFAPGGLLEAHPPGEGLRWTALDGLLRAPGPGGTSGALTPPPTATRPVHVFGVSYVARVFQEVFAWLGSAGALHLYTLNPCMEFWEDVETDAEMRRRLAGDRRGRKVGAAALADLEDPFGLDAADNRALQLWGRPGRENIRLLDELTGCDFEGRFEDPTARGTTLLSLFQRDVLRREPERETPCAPERAGDGSLVLVEAPGVRREVEWVADEIWRLVSAEPAPGEAPLRFSDVAVIVNAADRDLYLPHLDAVFDAVHGLPRSVVDLPMRGESRVIEAALLLLDLPFGRFSRAEVLRVMTHPAILGRFEDVSAEDWAELADALGIYFGADRADLSGTYVEKDLLSWDQGLRRLVLGAYMTGLRSGAAHAVSLGGERYLPEELARDRLRGAARFGVVARTLLANAGEVRDGRRTLTEWAELFRAWIVSWLGTSDEADARDRGRALSALGRLVELDVHGRPVSGRLAAALAREALGGLTTSRGGYLTDGVVVSSFLPMRAIPFRAVFVLGLGEGRFPAANRRDPLDLRAVRRRAGDVTPAERDRYTFLETLLSARDRLYLSWVARDEKTGDPIQPSAVIQELADQLERGYVGEAGRAALVRRPPLRRYEDGAESLLPAAAWERRARALGEALREAAGQGDAAQDLEALRARLPRARWEALSRFLELPAPAPGRPATEGEGDVLRLSLGALRTFLECPLQAAAKVNLGLRTEDDDEPAAAEDEPFTLDFLRMVTTLRRAFGRASAEARPLEAVYEAEADLLELSGRLPTGVLGDLDRQGHRALLESWRAQVEGRLGPDFALRRVGFGRAADEGDAQDLEPPIELEVEVPGPDGPRRRRVELSGQTELLGDDLATSIVLSPAGAKTHGGRVLKAALRGLLDRAALAAVGRAGPDGHRVLVCHDGASWMLRAEPLSREAGRALLETLVSELLAGGHEVLLPAEAILEKWVLAGDPKAKKAPGPPSGEAVARAVRVRRDGDRAGLGTCDRGPVPHLDRYEPPDPDTIEAIVRRRFEPLVEGVAWEEA